MGDRANIVIRYSDDNRIFFYGHWEGSTYFSKLQKALSSKEGRSRWSDESYLARIIFEKFVGEDADPETGFGIAPHMCDNEHPFLEVVPEKKIVNLTDENFNIHNSWSFEDFINLNPKDFTRR